jgi:hypothetical protein
MIYLKTAAVAMGGSTVICDELFKNGDNDGAHIMNRIGRLDMKRRNRSVE